MLGPRIFNVAQSESNSTGTVSALDSSVGDIDSTPYTFEDYFPSEGVYEINMTYGPTIALDSDIDITINGVTTKFPIYTAQSLIQSQLKFISKVQAIKDIVITVNGVGNKISKVSIYAIKIGGL